MKRFYLILLSALFIVIVGTPSAVRSQTLSVLHSFSWSASGPFNDGYAPASYDAAGGQNILVYNGRLYGLTMYGGSDANNVGVLFSCLPDGTDWRILHYFSTVTGGYRPWGSLIEVGGTLYGTTYYGGASGSDQRGTIFSISPFSGLPYTSNYTVLHTFNFPDDIYYPHGTLYHYNGVLYGTCSGGTGGSPSYGGVFAYDLNSSTYSRVHVFSAGEAYQLIGSLVYYAGRLYGLSMLGGANNGGSIYSFDPANTADFDVHYSFPANSYVMGDLVAYGGNLYGTTYQGGASTVGSIFKFDPVAESVTTIYSFSLSGQKPRGGLTVCNDKFWGLATYSDGGGCCGTLFSINPDGSGYTVEQVFTSATTGEQPQGTLTRYNGYFYGMASYGGTATDGTVFRYGPIISKPIMASTSITNNVPGSATGNGNILDCGGENCDIRGFCWSTNQNPTTADNTVEENGSYPAGAFSLQITGLTPGATYYVRAYAHNSAGYEYGNQYMLVNASQIPTLSEWGLIAFGGLIAVIGGVVVWRKIS